MLICRNHRLVKKSKSIQNWYASLTSKRGKLWCFAKIGLIAKWCFHQLNWFSNCKLSLQNCVNCLNSIGEKPCKSKGISWLGIGKKNWKVIASSKKCNVLKDYWLIEESVGIIINLFFNIQKFNGFIVHICPLLYLDFGGR